MRKKDKPARYSKKVLDQKFTDSYRKLFKQILVRLLLEYLVPSMLLIGIFLHQYNKLQIESHHAHLRSIAEYQVYALELFLKERVYNLSHILDNPRLLQPPHDTQMVKYLEDLKKASDAFIDLGFFDEKGNVIAYSGPYLDIGSKNYSKEKWFMALKNNDEPHVITDIYLGFRGEPHFSIAVGRTIDGKFRALRTVTSPQKIHKALKTLGQSKDTYISIVNSQKEYLVVSKDIGEILEKSPYNFEKTPWIGIKSKKIENSKLTFAYAWLETAPWVLIVQEKTEKIKFGYIGNVFRSVIIYALLFILFEFLFLWFRAKRQARCQLEADEKEEKLSHQLVHAARLATVGELAAGIAHEINNPLAIIAEEVGLVKDLRNPEFNSEFNLEELDEHLNTIYEAVFRARDITSKLLGFVRKKEIKLDEHHIPTVLDEVLDGLLGSEFTLSDIEVIRDYSPTIPKIVTDKNLLVQVFLNIIKNAFDAMDGKGKLTVHTRCTNDTVTISVSDTGCGMSKDQREKIFMPFYTTKEVGKGTGLGLSVSYGIIKDMGGNIYVDSQPQKGSMFTLELPIKFE